MAMPIMGHLDPDFFQIMEDVKNMLREVYHTANFMTLPISSTGTGAMETACANVLERGDTMVVCRNGYFGIRLADIAQRCGADVHVVDTPWGRPVDPQALDDELSRHPSSSAILNCWVKGFQLDARIGGGEAPVHSHHVPVALVLPGVNFPAQHLLIRNPAVQALPGQHSDFNFSHVQPTPMLGGVVNLQTFGDTPRFYRLERLV